MTTRTMGFAMAGLLAAVLAAGCGGPDKTPIGHFSLYRYGGGTPDSHQHFELYYGRHRLTSQFAAASIDPFDPDRILFTSDTTINSTDSPCGTYFFDGHTGAQRQIANWNDGLGPHSWSPNALAVLLRGGKAPSVAFLGTDETVDLASAISAQGRQVDIDVAGWSPDSERVALVVENPAAKFGDPIDWDLVEVTISTKAVRYVATIRSGLADQWKPAEYAWQDGRLIAAAAAPQAEMRVKDASEIGWTTDPPDTLRARQTCG